MKGPFKLGDFELFWLNGGEFELDGGAMFGVVPKALWSKKYPVTEDNYIPMVAYPILIKTNKGLLLIETGLGNKLTLKQKEIFRVKGEWDLVDELRELGYERTDIEHVIITHFDFDHSGGLIMENGKSDLELTFPKAKIYLQKNEWEDVLNPNKRSINTFWKINYEKLGESKNLYLLDGQYEVLDGITVIPTGGHNRGHQIVIIRSKDNVAIHFADLMPTHAHYNPLWVMAYDNYPLESISKKEYWENYCLKNDAWIIFYHDPFVLAGKFDEKGNLKEKWPL
ncbi:MAG: MBL fold metallo-hydrolase [Proteobacteria bacterium]|nr:MBL fold metallo-hydrolase [Pseudomonadota bacterium]